MSFPTCEDYSVSGVDWLGKLPSRWKVTRLNFVAEITMGQSPASEDCNLDGIGLPFLQGCAEFGISHPISRQFCDVAKKHAQAGDLLFSVRAPVGATNVADREYGIGRGLCSIRAKSIESSFLFWSMEWHKGQLAEFATGSTYDSVTALEVGCVWLALPSQSEQKLIAAFLDRETARIDALIEEQQRLIELLKEKRQAVISHAVTKGLDPTAPMKDSGVEWLGEVPAHWDVKAIKWLSPVLRGASPRPIDDPKYFDDDGQYAWVRIADASASDGLLRVTTQRLSDIGSSLSVKLEPGSLFVSIAGTVGKPCIAGIKCCIHDGFVYFPRVKIDPMFLFRLFEVGDCYAGLGKMGTQLNLNTDTIGSIRLGLPPHEELSAILAFIDSETKRFDRLATEVEAAKLLLLERRSALISAAVTGKIDVRSLVEPTLKPEPEPA